jgi:hypothetical protein
MFDCISERVGELLIIARKLARSDQEAPALILTQVDGDLPGRGRPGRADGE